jgi:hypothetical protein
MLILRVFIVAATLVLADGRYVAAQATTAFKTGEQTTGMTKQCFYKALGNEYTRTVRSVELCPLSIRVASTPRPSSQPAASAPPRSTATITAFKRGERKTGMTKQCFYDGLGSTYTRTIGSTELCPLSIQVRPGGP